MTHAAGWTVDGPDPIQLQVEATIRRVVSDLVELPCQVARAAARRVGEPVAMVRSLGSITVSGFTGRLWPSAPDSPAPSGSTASPAPPRPPRSAQVAPTATTRERPSSAAALPLDDYESLAASQVVARLDRLDPGELRQVKAFESAHRGRRTVLGKIDQLLAAAPA